MTIAGGFLVLAHAPSSIKVETIYEFVCFICKETVQQSWFGVSPDYPNHPGPGWQQIGRECGSSIWICPKHKVVITVDGKELEA